MAVPAHDSRDYAFAKHFGLPIIPLIEGADVSEESFDAKEGTVMNSPMAGKTALDGFSLNGLSVKEAIAATKKFVTEKGLGRVKVNYRLRDAIFSRQRYWGEPFPVYYKDGMPYMIPRECLPLELPEIDEYKPTETGEPPLGRAKKWAWDTKFDRVVDCSEIDNKSVFPLELNTMPGFAGSSAYYLRYMDPKNDKALTDKEKNEYWRNVDLYVGGSEHATGHLIYSRFWNKFLYDSGYTCEDEPFKKLVNQGMIQGRSNFVYRIDDMGDRCLVLGDDEKNCGPLFVSLSQKDKYKNVTPIHVDVNIVENDILDINAFRAWRPEYELSAFVLEDGSVLTNTQHPSPNTQHPTPNTQHPSPNTQHPSPNTQHPSPNTQYKCGWAIEKMSKSMYNVVNPDDVIEKYGADTLRLFEMFLGPVEQSKPWDTNNISGSFGFLNKFWNLLSGETNDEAPTPEELKSVHKLIKKVTQDIEQFSYNTSISAFMICRNELSALKCKNRELFKTLTILIAPFAPHIAEELWEKLGGEGSVCDAQWPEWNEEYLVESSVKMGVAFNGKTRFEIELAADADNAAIEQTVREDERTAKYVDGKQIMKVIIVPKRMVNIVLK